VYSSQRGRERPARARAALALSPSNVGEQLGLFFAGLFFASFAVKASARLRRGQTLYRKEREERPQRTQSKSTRANYRLGRPSWKVKPFGV
jgi:hypothetical protein